MGIFSAGPKHFFGIRSNDQPCWQVKAYQPFPPSPFPHLLVLIFFLLTLLFVQDAEGKQKEKAERLRFGRFFYRFPNGESG